MFSTLDLYRIPLTKSGSVDCHRFVPTVPLTIRAEPLASHRFVDSAPVFQKSHNCLLRSSSTGFHPAIFARLSCFPTVVKTPLRSLMESSALTIEILFAKRCMTSFTDWRSQKGSFLPILKHSEKLNKPRPLLFKSSI